MIEAECPLCGHAFPLDRDLLLAGVAWVVCPRCMTRPDAGDDPDDEPAAEESGVAT